MKIYIDYVFFINFLFDYIILVTEAIILKRNITKKRIIISSIFGGLSGIILFLNIPSFLYFFLKILSGLILIIICFKYKDLKYTFINFIYLILISIILGGTLYLINLEFGYQENNILFFSNNKIINSILLIFISSFISYLYIKLNKIKTKILKTNYKVDLYINNKIIKLNGFLDTGNKLHDPYFNKPILILNKNLNIKNKDVIFVPFNTLNSKGLLKCFFTDIYIHDVGNFKKVLVGISNDKFLIPGVDIILNEDLLEDI